MLPTIVAEIAFILFSGHTNNILPPNSPVRLGVTIVILQPAKTDLSDFNKYSKSMKNLDNIEHIENSKDCDLENQISFEDGQSTIGYFLRGNIIWD